MTLVNLMNSMDEILKNQKSNITEAKKLMDAQDNPNNKQYDRYIEKHIEKCDKMMKYYRNQRRKLIQSA